ncbi:tetratricopeptide repeat protein [Prochlorothrix hollandica]|uniref:tetratricopeptide repeat protein n=1 Tax=Prochlorothrix hollandica TaxID=1223 RepID=UPI0003707A0F|nr:tetratricopeptide repeat protein [Prochlorothrix hollandica]
MALSLRRPLSLPIPPWFLSLLILGSLATPGLTAESYRIVEVSGTVQVKRQGQGNAVPVSMGTALSLGDRLLAGQGSWAKILCDNAISIWRINAGEIKGVAYGCPRSVRIALRSSRSIEGFIGDVDATVPYALSPRKSAIRAVQPLLRWNPVPGATRYQVTLMGIDNNWSTETSETQVRYSGEIPLEEGLPYVIRVKTDTGVSAQQPSSLLFWRIDAETEATIAAAEAELDTQDLSPLGNLLARVELYRQFELFSEAIDLLNAWVTEETATPQTPDSATDPQADPPVPAVSVPAVSVQQLLGELHQTIGLNQLALDHYSQALALAQTQADLPGQAQAQWDQAEALWLLGRKEDSAAAWRVAQDLYRTWGDEEQVTLAHSSFNFRMYQGIQIEIGGTLGRPLVKGSRGVSGPGSL